MDQGRDFIFRPVEDGLNQRLEGRVLGLELVDVLFVDAFAAVVGAGIVDALGIVNGGASGAGGSIAIALVNQRRGSAAVLADWACECLPLICGDGKQCRQCSRSVA